MTREVTRGAETWSDEFDTSAGLVRTYVLRIDRRAGNFGFFAQPGQGRLFTGQTPQAVDRRLREAGLDVVASMNADFWSSSQPGRFHRPTGLHITSGVVAMPPNERSALMMAEDGQPFIDRVELEGSVVVGDKRFPIKELNNTHTTEGLVLITQPYGRPVEAHTTRPVILIQGVGDGPRANVLHEGVVCGITDEGWVEMTSVSVMLLDNDGNLDVTTGTQLGVDLRLAPGNPHNAVGGGPRLVRAGVNSALEDGVREKLGRKFTTDRHPRTAVGHSADGNVIWWVVVDGRRPGHSVGISLPDLADYLIQLGASEAINLDGGGSSCIVVDGAVLNRPSDKTPRPVANTIHLLRQ